MSRTSRMVSRIRHEAETRVRRETPFNKDKDNIDFFADGKCARPESLRQHIREVATQFRVGAMRNGAKILARLGIR